MSLACPVCSLPLSVEEKSALCPNGHSFDRAKEGYFNLLLSSSGKGHGDDKEMLLARRLFLEKGYYEPLLCALQEETAKRFPQGGTLLDSGCGEGYYTEGITRYLKERGGAPSLYAFDISKAAMRLCSKKLKGEGHLFVASAFAIPVEAESVSVALSLFAPYAEAELMRVLKPNGFLIRAVPLENHLFSLKKAVYDCPTKNEKAAVIGDGFSLVGERRIQGTMNLQSPEEIQALFGMTPYAHKTSPGDLERMRGLTRLQVEMDLGVFIYEKVARASL